ncbi:delta-aminolevulinic acid synthetase, putative [Plasmodium malariae]|uniref:5-aminolevulinate synthase n=1 Tax=Plasmodium malariae TaxID=5858 RepID=A0A1D3TFN2_PLAMA|nr:delta-aminolevulinic acid synthetase, putative [Plasmodium malariae]SCP03731.1 delta-aminolevulinic acid synthetase, putative [Plasmodium malariae]
MRKEKTLKVSIDEIKKYCPFVKQIHLFYKSNDNKNNVVLSVMSNLCPIGKAINEKHIIIIDNKSKINLFKILRGSNIGLRHLVETCIKKNDTIDNVDNSIIGNYKKSGRGEEKGHSEFAHNNEGGKDSNIPAYELIMKNNFSKTLTRSDKSYEAFQKECSNELKGLINNLFLDKRYRVFNIINKCRKYYPSVYIENNRLLLPIFYEFYQRYGYMPCIGNAAYKVVGSPECSSIRGRDIGSSSIRSSSIGSSSIGSSSIRSSSIGSSSIGSSGSGSSGSGSSGSGSSGSGSSGSGSSGSGSSCKPSDGSRGHQDLSERNERYLCNFLNVHKGRVTNEKTVVWCSNDYLCLSNNEKIIDVGIETLKKIGNSSGGTRNISGSLVNHTHLEYILARWFNKESALLFTSGYVANVGALGTLGKLLNLIYVSDEMNHASIINGIKESKCEKYIFKHNDMVHLEKILKNLRMENEYANRKIMIVFESIYSMSGHISPIPQIVHLAKKYNALTYVDEVHAVGLYGRKGSGYLEELNMCDHIDIINGTLSKAIGSLGGFICANKFYIDVIRSYCSHFIFTTSLTPVNINTSAEAIHIIQNDRNLRNKFRQVVKKTKEKLIERGIHIIDNKSHIVVSLINSAEKCKQICDDLLSEYNIYIQPINYPTVPKGSERIRITPSPYHTDEHISKLSDSLYTLFKRHEVNMFDMKIKLNEVKL